MERDQRVPREALPLRTSASSASSAVNVSLPFRVGTTSYILPADILPNARHLAGKVDDIELLLFELDETTGNFPSKETVRELAALRAEHALGFTVHLPLDLRLANEGNVSIEKGVKAIEITRPLDPWAYVLHVDGREIETAARAIEAVEAIEALAILAEAAGGPERLAVENVERVPLDRLDSLLARFPASRCIDVGHLWLDGHDPLPFLERHIARARVVHIHGIGERDHRSLALAAPDMLDPVMAFLCRAGFDGVLTIEVFGEEDFISSREALRESLNRVWPAS